MQLWKSNNRAPLASWWNQEQATIVTVSLSCALEFSAHLFPPVAPLAHNCWTALMRTLHCRSAASLVCPSSLLSFFSSCSPAFLHQRPVCGVTTPCCLACFCFLWVFFSQTAFDDAQDSHYNDLWQNVFCRSSPPTFSPIPQHPLRSPPTHWCHPCTFLHPSSSSPAVYRTSTALGGLLFPPRESARRWCCNTEATLLTLLWWLLTRLLQLCWMIWSFCFAFFCIFFFFPIVRLQKVFTSSPHSGVLPIRSDLWLCLITGWVSSASLPHLNCEWIKKSKFVKGVQLL